VHVVFDTKNLNPPAPTNAEGIRGDYATYDGKIADPTQNTGRKQYVFRGFSPQTDIINLDEPLENGIRKIHMSVNTIFERLTLFQITQRSLSI
jgi:hypothetical protein